MEGIGDKCERACVEADGNFSDKEAQGNPDDEHQFAGFCEACHAGVGI